MGFGCGLCLAALRSFCAVARGPGFALGFTVVAIEGTLNDSKHKPNVTGRKSSTSGEHGIGGVTYRL